MFSHKGLALDSETLEYAWLVEAIVGDITGKLTSPQVSRFYLFFVVYLFENNKSVSNLFEFPSNFLHEQYNIYTCN